MLQFSHALTHNTGRLSLTHTHIHTHTRRSIHTLLGHRGEISSVAFDYSGNMLATGSMDKTCKVWDIRSGELVSTLRWVWSVVM